MKPELIYETAQESVVTIITYDFKGEVSGTGSGVVISDDGMIVTNYHVLRGCMDFAVRAGEITIRDVDVLAFSFERDLAVLKPKKKVMKPVSLCDPDKLKIGQTVFSIGNPLGEFENTFSGGMISGFRELDQNDFRYIQFTSPISPGNSGGALLSEECELIGITTMSRRDGNDLYFAIPINVIDEVRKESEGLKTDECRLFLLAQNAYINDENRKAVDIADKLLKINPRSFDGRFAKAKALADLEKYESALTELEEARSISPENEQVFFEIGRIYEKLNRPDEALNMYSKALKSDPDNPEFYCSRGWLLCKMEKFSQAIPDFDKAIEIDPVNSRPYFDRAYAYRRFNNLDQAENDYLEAVNRESENYVYWVELGNTYEQNGKLSLAVMCYNQAISIEMFETDLIMKRGMLWLSIHNYQNAVFDFTSILEMEEDNRDALENRGRAFVAMQRSYEAESDFRKLIDLDGNDYNAHNLLGDLFCDKGDFESGIEHFNRSIEIQPNADAFYLRALIHKESGNKNQAREDLENVLSLSPDAYELVKPIMDELK